MEGRAAKVNKHFLLTENVITYHGKAYVHMPLSHVCLSNRYPFDFDKLFHTIIDNHTCLKFSNPCMNSLVLSIIQCSVSVHVYLWLSESEPDH